jgi:hypothetical protein
MEYNGAIYQSFIDFGKAYDSVRRELMCNILIEFGTCAKKLMPIKMCLKKPVG